MLHATNEVLIERGVDCRCPVTHDDPRFLFRHGVTPVGTTSAFVELPAGDVTVAAARW